MIRPTNETEDILLSIAKNCETLIKQTHTKPQETETKNNQPREIFSFKPSISYESFWMMGLSDLEVHNSGFDITEEFNKFDFFTDDFDEFSFVEVGDELEEILSISDNIPKHLQLKLKAPRNIKTYNKL